MQGAGPLPPWYRRFAEGFAANPGSEVQHDNVPYNAGRILGEWTADPYRKLMSAMNMVQSDPTTEEGQALQRQAYEDTTNALAQIGIINSAVPGRPAGSLGMFVGPKAKTADLAALSKAEQLAAGGAENEAIRQATGWFKGMDGKWRFEIPDNNAFLHVDAIPKIRVDSVPQGSFLYHSDLYSAYPELNNVWVKSSNSASGGSYSGPRQGVSGPGVIELGVGKYGFPNEEKILAVNLHENQHAIQDIENFAKGGNPGEFGTQIYNFDNISDAKKYFNALSPEEASRARVLRSSYDDSYRVYVEPPYGQDPHEMYRNLSGEIEARDVADRMNMTQEQRRKTPPRLIQNSILRF